MPKIETAIELISPRKAFEYLDRNTHNRPVRDTTVQCYAAMMLRGEWTLTHQGIAFNEYDVLTDGQHRLWAINEAGEHDPDFKGVRMMVTRGVEAEAMLAIDQNMPRTFADSINLTFGQKITNLHVSVARAMMGGFSQNVGKRVDIYTVNNFIEKYQTAINNAVMWFTPRRARLSQAQVVAVVARAVYNKYPEDQLKSFVNILRNGLMTDAAETPAILLRNFLLEKSSKSMDTAVVYAKTERALRAFLDKEPITTLYATADELFPIAGEALKAKPILRKSGLENEHIRMKALESRRKNLAERREAGLPLRKVKVVKGAAKAAKSAG